MLRVFHHTPRRGDRMHDAFEARDAACAVRLAVHDAGVELHIAGGVRPAAEADGTVGRQLLDGAHALFDCVERRAAALQFFERAFGADLAERPRCDRHGARRRPGVRRSRAGGEQGGCGEDCCGRRVHAPHAMRGARRIASARPAAARLRVSAAARRRVASCAAARRARRVRRRSPPLRLRACRPCR